MREIPVMSSVFLFSIFGERIFANRCGLFARNLALSNGSDDSVIAAQVCRVVVIPILVTTLVC